MNSSNLTLLPPVPYQETYWITSEVILITVTAIAFHYLFGLVLYVVSLKKRTKKKNKQKSLIILTLFSVVMAIFRFISDQFVAFLGWSSNTYCVYSVSVSTVLYALSLTPIYIFLWRRQHSFYSNSQMKHIHGNTIRFLSYFTLVFLTLSGMAVGAAYVIPSATGWSFQATQTGCRDANDQQDVELVPMLAIAFTGCGQLSLLGLLLYPLLKCKKNQKIVGNSIKKNQDNVTEHQARNIFPVEEGMRFDAEDADNCTLSNDSDQPSCSKSNFNHEENNCVNLEIQNKLRAYYDKSSTFKQTYKNQNHPSLRNKQAYTGHRRTTSNNSVFGTISRKQKSMKTTPNSRTGGKSAKRREKRLQRLITKVFCLAVGCVISDIIALVLQLLLLVPELAYIAIYDINLIINITCIIVSFDKWSEILLPCRKWCDVTVMTRTGSTSSQSSLPASGTKLETLDKKNTVKRNFTQGHLSDTPSLSEGGSHLTSPGLIATNSTRYNSAPTRRANEFFT